MNSEITKFNKEIKHYLTNDLDTSYSNTIKLICKLYPNTNNYHTIFDSFTFRMGMGMLAIPVYKGEKNIGYLPKLKYYPNNLFKKEPGVEDLINNVSPVRLNQAYTCLAKESLYRIARVKELEEIIYGFLPQ